jgi:hypothetical protein
VAGGVLQQRTRTGSRVAVPYRVIQERLETASGIVIAIGVPKERGSPARNGKIARRYR